MKTLEELKDARNLADYAKNNLERSRDVFYCCPVCGSGTRTGTGALSVKGRIWKCFSCGAGGSIVDLIMATENINTAEAIKRLTELYGDGNENETTPSTHKPKVNRVKPKAAPKTERQDFRTYLIECHKHIGETDYPAKRGLNEWSVQHFYLGYDPTWVSPTAKRKRDAKNKERVAAGKKPLPAPAPSPRLIIPLSVHNYLARDTRPDTELTERQKDYKKMNEGQNKPFFNPRAMLGTDCFFVVEGEIDAISVEQAGGHCVALCSTVKAEAFGRLLKKLDPGKTGTLILSLDNDEPGRVAAEKIKKACETLGIRYIQANASGPYKDPNEYLVKDKEGFCHTIQNIIRRTSKQ